MSRSMFSELSVVKYVITILMMSTLLAVDAGQAENAPAVAVRSQPQTTGGTEASTLGDPTAAAVAREIVDIQQKLGGSIVDQHSGLQGWVNPAGSLQTPMSLPMQLWNHPLASPIASSENPTVTALRESAWQLDMSANRLESHDLYSQADAMRKLAVKLREDARILKQVDPSASPPTEP